MTFARVIDTWRRDTLGLPNRPGRHDPTVNPDGSPARVLHAHSPAVLPRPADWPANADVTGYWFLPPEPGLPVEVERFLEGGPAPVFAGFGSMTGRDPVGATTAVVEAAAANEVRLVVGTGWGGLDAATAVEAGKRFGVELVTVGNVDFQRLFPWMAAVVHHGGAGTTGVAFTAGRPQVVCPFVADQPFWGRIVQARGVGPAPLPQTKLIAPALTERIAAALTPAAAAAAARIGDQIRQEHGLANAVAAIKHTARTAVR